MSKTGRKISYFVALFLGLLLPLLASAQSVEILYNFGINSSASTIYGLPTVSSGASYTELTLQEESSQGVYADCASPNVILVNTGSAVNSSDFPVSLGSQAGGTFWTLCAVIVSPFQVVGQAELGVDASSSQWYDVNNPGATTAGLPDAETYISEVGTNGLPNGASFFDQYATATVGTSTLVSATNLLSFLNVPELLSTRIPFSYIFQIYSALTSALSTTSSDQLFPTGTFSMSWPTAFSSTGVLTATTTLTQTYLSTTTLTEIMGPTLLAIIRTLLGAIVYVELGFWLWKDARSKKHLF